MILRILLTAAIVVNPFLSSPVLAQEGHEAGREWAEENNIDDPDDCESAYLGRWDGDNINNSPSFTEGCLEYLRDEGITDENDELKGFNGNEDEEDDSAEDEGSYLD